MQVGEVTGASLKTPFYRSLKTHQCLPVHSQANEELFFTSEIAIWRRTLNSREEKKQCFTLHSLSKSEKKAPRPHCQRGRS